jgi:hypothetical protein
MERFLEPSDGRRERVLRWVTKLEASENCERDREREKGNGSVQ